MRKDFQLLLLRHGNTFEENEIPYQIGKTDLPLTPKGRSQIQAFAHFLKKERLQPQHIYSGALQRQTQSARIVQEAFPEADLLKHPALDEIDYGQWEGCTREAIAKQWSDHYYAWQHQGVWPDVFKTSERCHLDLLTQWLEEISHLSGLIVAVSSHGILRLLLHFIPDLWQTLCESHQLHRYQINTGHYCELKFDQHYAISSWNKAPA